MLIKIIKSININHTMHQKQHAHWGRHNIMTVTYSNVDGLTHRKKGSIGDTSFFNLETTSALGMLFMAQYGLFFLWCTTWKVIHIITLRTTQHEQNVVNTAWMMNAHKMCTSLHSHNCSGRFQSKFKGYHLPLVNMEMMVLIKQERVLLST